MKILGTGVGLPKLVVKNSKIEEWGLSTDKWIRENLGIRERRVSFAPSSALGAMAAKEAIQDAGLKPEDIDLIIVATSTPDKLNPSTACIIQDKIGAYNATCFDINAVCSGFIYGLIIAERLVERRNALVIGVDTFSHITDWKDRNCVFFGDGAGAAIVTFEWEKLYYAHWESDGGGRHVFETDHGDTFRMNGKAVYKQGTTVLPDVINRVLNMADLKIDDIQWMLPHQASIKMLKDLAKKIGIPWKKVKTNMDKYGNTAAASIPILLHENKKDFKKGDYILMAAIGSGWTYGSIIIQW